MKRVLISIQPYWVFLIIAKTMGWNIDKEKTIEVRKNYPKDENWDKVAKIYCSKDRKSFAKIPKKYQPFMEQYLGKVIGEFVCDDIDTVAVFNDLLYCVKNSQANKLGQMCLTIEEIKCYLGEKNQGYNWHISDLVIYDKPKELSEFYISCGDNPKCEGCKAHYYSNTECGKEDYCCSVIEGCKPLTRPPQSWCYVRERRW